MHSLLIIDPDAATYKNEITSRQFPDLRIFTAADQCEARRHINIADLILGRPDLTAPLLQDAPMLRWLQSTFAGIELLCKSGLRRDYTLTGIKDIFGPLMSEYVFSYILAIERSLLETRENQLRRLWLPLAYRGLSGLNIGIAGLGSIGRDIAKTASHFGMNVSGINRAGTPVAFVEQVFAEDEKETFLASLDYLVVTLPETADTIHFFSHDDFSTMKETAFLICVGRGSNINEYDLIRALNSKEIAGAVLDVFENEPLPTDSPLWTMNNVYVTPHNSACSFPAQIASIFCDNYSRFTSGRKLKYIVDFDKGY